MVSAEAPTTQTNIDFLAVERDGAHPQNQFYHSEVSYPFYYGGVGIGKSLVLVVDFFEYAMAWPRSAQVLTEPTYDMVRRILLPTVDKVYGPLVGQRFELTRHPPIEARFPNGSNIWFLSTDVHPERLYGANLARVGMDEVTLGHQEEAFDILAQRCREPGFLHQVKMTGTPKGRNWAWKRLIGNPMPGVATFFAETADSERGGLLPKGYLERLLGTYGGWDNPLARQELGGQWLQMAGQVFQQFSRNTHIRELDKPEAWKLLKQRLGGIDFGGVSPTALIAAGLDAGGRVMAFREWYRYEATMDDTISAMADLRQTAGIETWIADPSGAKEIQLLRNAGFNVRGARHGNKLNARVQLVGARLNVHPAAKLPGLFITSACPNLITEIETLAWRRVKLVGQAEEMMADEFERGAPDHAFDGLANIVAEYDGSRPPVQRERESVDAYGR